MPISGSLDNFKTTKTLGSGFSAKVKLAYDQETGKDYALKLFDLENPKNNKKAIELLRKEVQATKNFDHKHIVKYYSFKEESTYTKTSGREIKVAYIAQEPILGGELFDYVAIAGAFTERICRYYFK